MNQYKALNRRKVIQTEKQSSAPAIKPTDTSVDLKRNSFTRIDSTKQKLISFYEKCKRYTKKVRFRLTKRARKRFFARLKNRPTSFKVYRSSIIKPIQKDFLVTKLDSNEIKLLDPHKSLKDFQQLFTVLSYHNLSRLVAPSILIYVPDVVQYSYMKELIDQFSLSGTISVTSEKYDIINLGEFIVQKVRRTKMARPRERFLIVLGNNDHKDLADIQMITQKSGIHLSYFITPRVESVAHGYFNMANNIDDFNKINFFFVKLCGYILSICGRGRSLHEIKKLRKLRKLNKQVKKNKYGKTSSSQKKTII
jgi:hypothetical protein